MSFVRSVFPAAILLGAACAGSRGIDSPQRRPDLRSLRGAGRRRHDLQHDRVHHHDRDGVHHDHRYVQRGTRRRVHVYVP